jgi:hypothetical protein
MTIRNNAVQRKRLRGLLTLTLLALAAPVHATLATYAHSNSSFDLDNPHGFTDYGTLIGDTSYASSSRPGPGNPKASASASYGVVKAFSGGELSAIGAVSTGSIAQYDDQLLLSNTALNGQYGRITLAYYFDYDKGFTAYGESHVNDVLSFSAWAGSQYEQYADYQSTTPDNTFTAHQYSHLDGSENTMERDVSIPNYIYLTADFRWGSYFTTGFAITTQGNIYNPGGYGDIAGSYYLDASHSGYWAGIVSATAGDQLITEYDLSSLSGTDYSRSFVPSQSSYVPEPGTPILLMLGLGMIGVHRLRLRGR